VTVEPFGDAAVLVHASAGDPDGRWIAVESLRDALSARPVAAVRDLVVSFEHLLVQFDPARTDAGTVIAALADRAAGAGGGGPAPSGQVLRVPVVFGGRHGPDLVEAADHVGTSPEVLVAAVTAQPLLVRFLGAGIEPMCTRPGSPPPVPRRRVPRSRVEAGSVGLAAANLTIYPFTSPGGWQLIGRTPATLCDVAREPLAPYRAGDLLQLVPVDESAWDQHTGPLGG